VASSKTSFNRWSSLEKSTWIYQVFLVYDNELYKNLWSYYAGAQFVYKTLGSNKAKWSDQASSHLNLVNRQAGLYNDLRDWSNSFNHFDNWVNLNVVMAMSSNFETYLASVISLALKSDPGILLGASKAIDGIAVLKKGTFDKLNYDAYITSCTKGEWSSRLSSFQKIFGHAPQVLQDNISDLETLRKLRNKVGHAFGRDIDESRKHGLKTVLKTETISRNRALKLKTLLWSISKAIDKYLLQNHVGEFQALVSYHDLYPTLLKGMHPNEKAVILKRKIGQSGAQGVGKQFCKELVKYYEGI
jgi:hypothetical protein